MAARLNRRHQEMVRSKIKSSQLLNLLQKHALDNYKEGERKADPSRIRAAEVALSFAMPKLSATEIDATIDDSRPETMTDAQLVAIAGGKRA